MVWPKASLSFATFLFVVASLSEASSSIDFKIKTVKIDQKSLKVWIADTEEKRSQGMMFKTAWGQDITGMLFIFENESRRSFWMKNTLLPLSLGFFNSDGMLLETANMDPPKSLAQVKIDRVLSLKPAKYVLEVPKGWFKNENIKAGAKLRLL